MKQILLLTIANLRKNAGQTIGMVVMIIIAALFLNISLVLYFDAANFFEDKAEELNAPHFVGIQTLQDGGRGREVYEFLASFEGISEIEIQYVITDNGGFYPADTLRAGHTIISRADSHQRMNPPSFLGDYLQLSYDSIYVPHFMILEGGFALGDEFILEFQGNQHAFTVAGGTQEIMFGAE
ncbi:MAG: hypothetical protein FWC67_04760, partial [Defluviitaleaceae bacterium]|nr:hypothetical protein [Defluviitaleaceae bacterium]